MIKIYYCPIFLKTDVRRAMLHYPFGILKRTDCYSVKMITGRNMGNVVRIVPRLVIYIYIDIMNLNVFFKLFSHYNEDTSKIHYKVGEL